MPANHIEAGLRVSERLAYVKPDDECDTDRQKRKPPCNPLQGGLSE